MADYETTRASYERTINAATKEVREGMRLAPTEQQRDLWFAMLERLACIEAMEER